MSTNPDELLQADSPDQASPDSPDSPYNPDDHPRYIEKWGPTVDAMIKATRKAFLSSPRAASRDEFRRYWHGVFTQLLEDVAADSDIPGHLTSPPTNKFVVNLFDRRHGMCCPCSLPDVDPTIELENEQGVGKMDLVKGMRDYLYGEKAPVVSWLVDDYGGDSEEREMETALVYVADWMSGGRNEDGEKRSYYFYPDAPEVFLYCCGEDGFAEWLGKQEEPKPKGKSRKA